MQPEWKMVGLLSKFSRVRYILEGLGIDGRSILEWMLNKYVSILGFGFIRLRVGVFREPL